MPKTTKKTYVRGLCVVCEEKPQASKGGGRYRPVCQSCHDVQCRPSSRIGLRSNGRRGYRLQKKTQCDHCDFKSVHKCQLDIDHKDGDKDNHHPDNIQTLCANCHRLKTFIETGTSRMNLDDCTEEVKEIVFPKALLNYFK